MFGRTVATTRESIAPMSTARKTETRTRMDAVGERAWNFQDSSVAISGSLGRTAVSANLLPPVWEGTASLDAIMTNGQYKDSRSVWRGGKVDVRSSRSRSGTREGVPR